MKRILFVLLILASCKSKDITDIKHGMKSAEVIKILGEPAEKHDMFIFDMWLYNDSKEEANKHVVVFHQDTVTRVTTKAEMRAKMRE